MVETWDSTDMSKWQHEFKPKVHSAQYPAFGNRLLLFIAVTQKVLLPKSSSLLELSGCHKQKEDAPSQNVDENTPISINSPHHGKQVLTSRAQQEHDLPLQDAKHSCPGQTLCSVRSFAATGTIQGGNAAAQEESKPNFHPMSSATPWN